LRNLGPTTVPIHKVCAGSDNSTFFIQLAGALNGWLLSNATTESPRLVRRLSLVIAVFFAAATALCASFFFVAPLVASVVAAAASGAAWWRLRNA
jgi:hypothetical protein